MQRLCEAAAADELKDIRWQTNDRDCAREVSKSGQFLYPIDYTGGPEHKLSFVVQMELSQVDFPNTMTLFDNQRLRTETQRALEVTNRLIRAVIECKASQGDGIGCSAALSLARCLSTKAWEHGPAQLIQVPQVGKALMRKFVGGNIRTVAVLADTPASTIERIASRNPPFGRKMTDALAWFPRLTLHTEVKTKRSVDNIESLTVVATLGYSNTVGTPKWGNKTPIVTLLAHSSMGTSVFFWRNSLKVFARGRNSHTLTFSWTPQMFEDQLICQFACEEIAGTLVVQRLAHNLASDEFPSIAKPVRDVRLSPSFCMDEDISDNDLLVAVEALPKSRPGEAKKARNEEPYDDFNDIDDFIEMDNNSNIEKPTFESSAYKSQTDKSIMRERSDSEEQPVRLDNSNFKCGHPCSWSTGGKTARGVRCGHQCCREGTKRPRKPRARSKKRKAEDGTHLPKRTRVKESASRPDTQKSAEKYIIDEDGFIDLTQQEAIARAFTQEDALENRSDDLGMTMDCNNASVLPTPWPLELTDAGPGDVLSNEQEVLENEDDSFWTELLNENPPKTGRNHVEGSVTDEQMAENTQPTRQNVLSEQCLEIDAMNEEAEILRPNQQLHEVLDPAPGMPMNEGRLVPRVNEHHNKRLLTPSEPEWVNEIDSRLIDELRGFVDFV